jgi:hypothetical protein
MTPPAPERPSPLDDLRTALRAPASFGVKLFEINVLQAIFAGDLLILRETLLEELGRSYMWLINLSLVDWLSLSEEDKELNTQMCLDWLTSYSKASEAVLHHGSGSFLSPKRRILRHFTTYSFVCAPVHLTAAQMRGPKSFSCTP